MLKPNVIRSTHYVVAALILVAYFIETGWDNLFAAVFLFLVMMTPIVINVAGAVFSRVLASQIVLLFATIAYSAWASLLYSDVIYNSSTDGQGTFALFATAIAALPVLIPLWVVCLVIEIRSRIKGRSAPDSTLTSS